MLPVPHTAQSHSAACREIMDISFELFKNAVDGMGSSMAILEPQKDASGELHDFAILYINDEACRTVEASKEENEGGSFLHLTRLGKGSSLFRLLAGVEENRQTASTETRLIKIGGAVSDEIFHFTCAPCKLGLAVSWQEVKKQRHRGDYTADELFETWSDSFAVFEVATREDGAEDLRVLASNRAFADLISHDYDTLPGKLFTETCAPGVDWLPLYINTAKTGVGSINEAFNHSVQKYLTAVQFSPAIGQVVLLVLDRTHLWHAEHAMREREKDLALLFTSMPSGCCMGKIIRDAEGNPVDALLELVNPAYERLGGFPTASTQGRLLSELSKNDPYFPRYVEVAEKKNLISFTKYLPATGYTLEAICFSQGDDHFVCVENDVTGRVKAELELAKSRAELEEKHRIIMAGIDYASKIQRNLLPQKDVFREAFKDHAVIWDPRDIVGGDIYWLKNFDGGAVLCVCDCTGHGTPGAFLTMLVVSAFETIVQKHNFRDTMNVIWQLEQRLVNVLNVNAPVPGKSPAPCDIHDGCDLAVLFVDNDGNVTISAGNTRVFMCNGIEVTQIKGQRIFVGEGKLKSKNDLNMVTIPAHADNKFYIASDGLFDQIGVRTHRPFGYQTFKKIILEHHHEPLSAISDRLWAAFEEHRGAERRRDDVELIAFQK